MNAKIDDEASAQELAEWLIDGLAEQAAADKEYSKELGDSLLRSLEESFSKMVSERIARLRLIQQVARARGLIGSSAAENPTAAHPYRSAQAPLAQGPLIKSGRCPKCDSRAIWRTRQLPIGHIDGSWQNLDLGVESDMSAYLCQDCGYLELYLDKPQDFKPTWRWERVS